MIEMEPAKKGRAATFAYNLVCLPKVSAAGPSSLCLVRSIWPSFGGGTGTWFMVPWYCCAANLDRVGQNRHRPVRPLPVSNGRCEAATGRLDETGQWVRRRTP